MYFLFLYNFLSCNTVTFSLRLTIQSLIMLSKRKPGFRTRYLFSARKFFRAARKLPDTTPISARLVIIVKTQ